MQPRPTPTTTTRRLPPALVLTPVLVLALAGRPAAAGYCSLDSCRGRPHTMCQYPSDGLADACSQPAAGGVTAQDQAEILAAHNVIRQAVSSGQYATQGLPAAATPLPALAWDAELAQIAQRWANQCALGHDQCRNVERFYVGQNAAWTWGSPRDPRSAKNWTAKAVGAWFHGELPDFTQTDLMFRSGVNPSTGKQIGHLTQVIWADTTLVGCGYVESKESFWVKRSYFCNYGPGGNILGRNIYEKA